MRTQQSKYWQKLIAPNNQGIGVHVNVANDLCACERFKELGKNSAPPSGSTHYSSRFTFIPHVEIQRQTFCTVPPNWGGRKEKYYLIVLNIFPQ